MELRLAIPMMVLLGVIAAALPAQQPTANEQGSGFSSPTTNVLVPTLVRDGAGKVVYTLQADDFLLTDDDVPQELTLLQDTEGEPLALVIVIESGSGGARQFQKYERLVPPLAPMLWSIVGNVFHRVAVVTFDSSPKLIQTFTPDLDEAAATLRDLWVGCSQQDHFPNCSEPKQVHDKPTGDNGAAILDSLVFAVDMLRTESADYRRTILLVSETVDRGSATTMEQAVRAITDTNTTIYAIGFSTEKSEAAHNAHHQLPLSSGAGQLSEDPGSDPPHGCASKGQNAETDDESGKWSPFYDCAATIAVADSLLRNVPATVARLTGGEYFKLGGERNLEQDLLAIGNHLPNRYILSFHPLAPHSGLHALRLTLPDYEGLQVTARTSYWAEPSAPATPKR
jgi:VWFA-related protein